MQLFDPLAGNPAQVFNRHQQCPPGSFFVA
jgi:hypothetical protein